MDLSEMEQKVYDLIKERGPVTAKIIEENLGPKAVGGIGRLLRTEMVVKKKIRTGEGYNVRSVVHYVLKEKADAC